MKNHCHHSRKEYAAEHFSHLHVDSTGPLAKEVNNNHYALLLSDKMSIFVITTTCSYKIKFTVIIKSIITQQQRRTTWEVHQLQNVGALELGSSHELE
jgi:hypothetical protein